MCMHVFVRRTMYVNIYVYYQYVVMLYSIIRTKDAMTDPMELIEQWK